MFLPVPSHSQPGIVSLFLEVELPASVIFDNSESQANTFLGPTISQISQISKLKYSGNAVVAVVV